MTLTLVWPWPYVWPWPQTSQAKLNWCPGSKQAFSMRWTWPSSNYLDTQTWPRYDQDVRLYKKWSFYVNSFQSYSLNTHTLNENITSTAHAGGEHRKYVTGFSRVTTVFVKCLYYIVRWFNKQCDKIVNPSYSLNKLFTLVVCFSLGCGQNEKEIPFPRCNTIT